MLLTRYQAVGDADAAAWAASVSSAGGTYSAATLSAVTTFCKAAKASGYWSKLTRINLMCGDQLAAALVPLKVGGGSATDTNANFVSGDYTEATGLTGDGSTKYLNTGLAANALTTNSTHLAIYNRRSSATGHNSAIGANNGTSALRLYAPFSDAKVYSDQYDSTAGAGRVVTASTIATPFGFIVGSRTAAGAHDVYRNGSSVATSATSGGSLPAQSIFVFAQNLVGTAGEYSPLIAAGYSIGAGLTAAEVGNYYTHMQAFQTALGRNV